jgi:hypothetical protein
MTERYVKKTVNRKPGVLLPKRLKVTPMWGTFHNFSKSFQIFTTENGVTPRAVSNEREINKEDNKQKKGVLLLNVSRLCTCGGFLYN